MSNNVEQNAAADDPKRLVKVRLPLIKDDKRGDLFVSVNEYRYNIKRGVTVEIPWYIAEVIQNSVEQDERTMLRIEGMGKEAERVDG